ncbi:hypothetical protein AAMO2058_001512600 [Amorphochlora amoebiformis]
MFRKILRRMETWGRLNCVEIYVRIPSVLGPQYGCVLSKPGEEHLWPLCLNGKKEKKRTTPGRMMMRRRFKSSCKASAVDADENSNASDGNLSLVSGE